MKKRILSLALCAVLSFGNYVAASATEINAASEAATQTDAVPETATATDVTLQEETEEVAVSVNATDVTLYGLDDSYAEAITIPSGVNQKFQLSVSGAKSVSYAVTSGASVTVSDTGLIETQYTTWYHYDGYATTWPPSDGQTVNKITKELKTGDSTVTVTADGKTYTVKVHVVDYAVVYADQVMNKYISKNITSGMSDLDLMNKIAAFPAEYDYSPDYSGYVSMIAFGGGDCWASTSAIINLCDKLGIKAWARNGNKDAGAGSGHRNALVSYNGKYYELEAGYLGSAPRSYNVKERTSLFCYYNYTDGLSIYQYDGNDTSVTTLTIPSSINGKNVIKIADSYASGSLKSCFTKIELPETLTSIGKFAFSSHEKVKTIHIPASVTAIGTGAFAQCLSMTNITCAEGNANYSAANGVLYDKKKTTIVSVPAMETPTLADTATTMCEGAFSYNLNLKKVILPESMTAIADNAFFYCDNLEKIYIPETVTSIGVNAFYRCEDATIYGASGSYAETYAKNNNMTFVSYTPVTTVPNPVTNLKAYSAGGNQVKLTWTKSQGADGYLIYAQKNGKYGYCGMTSSTSYVDKKALDSDYNYYWVFPYKKDEIKDKMYPGGCTKYVYAKGVCPAAANVKAASQTGCVKLTWTASTGAKGYLIYGKTASGNYHYIGMTSSCAFTDKKASKTEYNFYWVYPYHTNASGDVVAGLGSGKYVYGKAK